MRHLRVFEHFDNIKDNDVVSVLRRDSSWKEVDPDRDHIACQFEYQLTEKIKAVIIGLDKVNGLEKSERIISLNLYLCVDDSLYYTDSVTQPYNRNHSSYRHTAIDVVKWCELVAKDQLQFFTEREKMPTDDELRDIFIEISEDMGYVLDDIKYGYTNSNFPRYNGTNVYDYDEDPFFSKSHKSSNKPKIVMVYSRSKSTPDVEDELDKLKSEVKSLNKRIDAFDYKCKCNFYPTSTRYFNGEHRPEQFIIIIESL